MKPAYVCQFCEGVIGSESQVAQHEKDCILNPFNRRCFSCKYYAEVAASKIPVPCPKLGMYCRLDRNEPCPEWEEYDS